MQEGNVEVSCHFLVVGAARQGVVRLPELPEQQLLCPCLDSSGPVVSSKTLPPRLLPLLADRRSAACRVKCKKKKTFESFGQLA